MVLYEFTSESILTQDFQRPADESRPQTNAYLILQEGSSLQFPFDKVHVLPNGASNTQSDIFKDVQDIVLSPLEGRNGCVIAYGLEGTRSGFK